MIKKFVLSVLAFSALSLTVQAQPANYNPEEAMKALGMLMGAGADQNTEAAPQIHFRQLKAFLPKEHEGMKRTSVEAGKNSAMGMTIGYAEAEYKGEDTYASINIQDISAMSGYMRMAQFAWASQEMERESEDGFERTTRIDGLMAKEEFRYRNNSGSIDLIVDDRFMVEVRGRGMEMDQLRSFVKALGLKKLAELKPEESEE